MLTINDLKQQNLILFEAISGSRAYGLALPHSDVDIRGVYYLPEQYFYGLNYIPQISNETNDEVYFEIGRFVELLLQNNPNVLELLASPEHCIQIKKPIMNLLKREYFLSKQCQQSFAGYAFGQIKKARGLNKKIVNPLPKEKKSLLEFCFIIENAQSIPLTKWLEKQQLSQTQLGLVSIDHTKHLYAVFVDERQELGYQGIIKQAEDSVILRSRVAIDIFPVAYLFFNQDGFTSYCRDYQSYWQWVSERNEERYSNNQAHGQNYDSKNMMHTFRLLETARDIALYREIIVERPNREALLAIRRGEFSYKELISRAEKLMEEVEILFANSDLPETADRKKALQALVEIRQQLYSGTI
ncbi:MULTISPECIES: DNA polymerase beta superfamily protein [unclassified Mannheimia]|uniref:DNA polymerase beta superfamily protein n=1 Tax=unclassified Mannheimia TaxID=2645054 RepID=UPI00359CED2E